MTRDATPYAAGRAFEAGEGYGFNPDKPEAGYYLVRRGPGTVRFAVRIWYGPPHDPWTGEEMDRGWRWQARADDKELIEVSSIWPGCAKSPITEAEWSQRCQRRQWAMKHAPESAYANRGAKFDPLSTKTPLPF